MAKHDQRAYERLGAKVLTLPVVGVISASGLTKSTA